MQGGQYKKQAGKIDKTRLGGMGRTKRKDIPASGDTGFGL